MTEECDRRRFVTAIGGIGGSGLLAGCLGGDSGPTDGGGPTETASPAGPTTGTATAPTAAPDSDLQQRVAAVNDVIERVNRGGPETNRSVAALNEQLQVQSDVAYVEPVSADSPEAARREADRLRDERDRLVSAIRTRVPREINERSPIDLVGEPSQYETAADFREAAADLQIERASEAMTDAAYGMEHVDRDLTAAAELLENASE